MTDPDNDFLHGAAEIAGFLRVSRRRFYYLAERGLIPAAKLGNTWTARKSRLIAHLESAENRNLGSPARTKYNPAEQLEFPLEGTDADDAEHL